MEVVEKAKKIIDLCLPEKSKNPVEIFNNIANDFWEEQGYILRTNLNYRNKSLNENVPQGE